MSDIQLCSLIGCICRSFPAVVCVSFSDRLTVFEFLQYISTSHRFISCLLCSFILVRYSVCHYQKHIAHLINFLEKINGLFLQTVNLLGNPICGYRKVLSSEMHISVNELFLFQLFIWIEFQVRLPSHQVDRSLYILRCALKTLVLYFCFPCRQKVWWFRHVQGFMTLSRLLRFFFLLTVNE